MASQTSAEKAERQSKQMTLQTVIHVDVTEIPALDIVCKKCKSGFVISLPKQDIASGARCPGCGIKLWNAEEITFAALTGIMRTLSAWQEEAKGMPFTLGFSLREP